MEKMRIKTTELGTTGLEITRVGLRRPEQVDPILTAAGLELTDENVDDIERRTS